MHACPSTFELARGHGGSSVGPRGDGEARGREGERGTVHRETTGERLADMNSYTRWNLRRQRNARAKGLSGFRPRVLDSGCNTDRQIVGPLTDR
jgi:hypothetical protein